MMRVRGMGGGWVEGGWYDESQRDGVESGWRVGSMVRARGIGWKVGEGWVEGGWYGESQRDRVEGGLYGENQKNGVEGGWRVDGAWVV